MGQRLKRWESPRREGRNDKGKGGSARQRQLKKRQQMLRQKIQDNSNNSKQGRDFTTSLFSFYFRKIFVAIANSQSFLTEFINSGRK